MPRRARLWAVVLIIMGHEEDRSFLLGNLARRDHGHVRWIVEGPVVLNSWHLRYEILAEQTDDEPDVAAT